MLDGLTKPYKVVATILKTGSEELTMSKVLPQLQAVANEIAHEKEFPVMMAKAKTRYTDHKGNVECWYCGEDGHVKANCPVRKKAEEKRIKGKVNTLIAL